MSSVDTNRSGSTTRRRMTLSLRSAPLTSQAGGELPLIPTSATSHRDFGSFLPSFGPTGLFAEAQLPNAPQVEFTAVSKSSPRTRRMFEAPEWQDSRSS